jgi:amino acid transporter
MGLITGSCAFAFAKLSRYHNSDNNGGAYIFVRSAFGRFVGFLVLFINYIIMPLTIVNQILYFVTINLDPIKAGGG